MEKRSLLLVLLLFTLLFLLGACADASGNTADKTDTAYKKITAEEARTMMDEDEGVIVVDVRTESEYDEGHIEGAILIPNETITDVMPEQLADADAVILIYCRSGRRSEEAARKLVDLGYTNVYDFGGIIDWPYDIVK